MFYNNYVAMDITNSNIRVVSLKNNRVIKWISTPLPEGIVKGGIIREPSALGVFLDNLFKSLKLKRNRVICTITGLPFIYRTVSMPDEVRIPGESIERESKREMSLDHEDMYLSWQATESRQNSREVDYFVVGVPRTSLNPLVESFSKARIKPYLIDIKPLALARAAGLSDALIVSLEKDYFDVVVVAGGLVRIIHSINPSSKSSDTIGLVNEIVDGLNKAIKSFGRDFPGNSLPLETPILLSGELSSEKVLPLLVQESAGHPVTLITSSLKTPVNMPIELFAAAMGLVAKTTSRNHHSNIYHDINLNLLFGLKRHFSLDSYSAYVFLSIVCLVLAVMVYKTYDLKIVAAAEVASLRQESAVVTQKFLAAQKANQQTLASRQAITDKYQNTQKQLEAVRANNAEFDSQKIDFASRIVYITDSLPVGTDFDTIDLQPNNIALTGKAQNALDVPDLGSQLEKSAYFSGARVEQLAPDRDAGYTFQISISNKITK